MTENKYAILKREDVNIDTVLEIFNNAGIFAEKNGETIIFSMNEARGTIYLGKDILMIFVLYKIKKDISKETLKERLTEMNSFATFFNAEITKSEENLSVSMSYITFSGIFIPHLMVTVQTFFAAQKRYIERLKISEFLE